MGHYDAAAAHLETFTQHNPNDTALRALHGVCLFKTGASDAAHALAAPLLRSECSSTVIDDLATAIECFDADLLEAFQAAAQAHAGSHDTPFRDIARHWLRIDRPSAALRAFKDVLEVKPADTATALELATLCESSGDLHGALVALENGHKK